MTKPLLSNYISFRHCHTEADFREVIRKATNAQLTRGVTTGNDLASDKKKGARHKCGIYFLTIVEWIEEEIARRAIQ
jgi:hypothetical protein